MIVASYRYDVRLAHNRQPFGDLFLGRKAPGCDPMGRFIPGTWADSVYFGLIHAKASREHDDYWVNEWHPATRTWIGSTLCPQSRSTAVLAQAVPRHSMQRGRHRKRQGGTVPNAVTLSQMPTLQRKRLREGTRVWY